MKLFLIFSTIFLSFLTSPLWAEECGDPGHVLYLKLSKELRCTVCQNQTLYDSGAALAQDVKTLIQTKIASGQNEDEIKKFLVERYGDFILYRPEFKLATSLLWGGAFIIISLRDFRGIERS